MLRHLDTPYGRIKFVSISNLVENSKVQQVQGFNRYAEYVVNDASALPSPFAEPSPNAVPIANKYAHLSNFTNEGHKRSLLVEAKKAEYEGTSLVNNIEKLITKGMIDFINIDTIVVLGSRKLLFVDQENMVLFRNEVGESYLACTKPMFLMEAPIKPESFVKRFGRPLEELVMDLDSPDGKAWTNFFFKNDKKKSIFKEEQRFSGWAVDQDWSSHAINVSVGGAGGGGIGAGQVVSYAGSDYTVQASTSTTLTVEAIEEAALRAAEQHGRPQEMLMNPREFEDYRVTTARRNQIQRATELHDAGLVSPLEAVQMIGLSEQLAQYEQSRATRQDNHAADAMRYAFQQAIASPAPWIAPIIQESGIDIERMLAGPEPDRTFNWNIVETDEEDDEWIRSHRPHDDEDDDEEGYF